MGVSPFSQVTRQRTRENSLELHHRRFRLDIMKNYFTESVVKQWNRVPSKVVESPFLELYNRCLDTALRDMV